MLLLVLCNACFALVARSFYGIIIHVWHRNEPQAHDAGEVGRTGIRGDLGDPLHLLILVRALPAPTVDPLLFLLVPYLPVPPLLLDALCLGELLPFGRGFGFG